jgi:hypothetical protein
MLSATIQELQSNSTKRILTVLLDAKDDDIEELPYTDESVSRNEEVHIPKHFQPKAKEIIKKLLASKIYSLANATTEVFTWVSIVEPFSIKFSNPHPSVLTLNQAPQVFNQIFTNINAQGKIDYQIKTFDGTLHYIEPNKIPYLALRSNHLDIVAPHLQAIEEEELSKSSGKERLLKPRKSF